MSAIQRFFLTLGLTAMWSPSFLFIKLALQDFPPITVGALRVTLGAVLLGGILLWHRQALPKQLMFWVHATIMGLFSMGLPFFLFPFAEQTIDSSLAAILNGTTPMFTALLAQIFVATDRLTIQKVVGIVLCATGLLLLFIPNIVEGVTGDSIGMLAVTMASMSYAIGHIYGKKYVTGHPPFVGPTAALIASSCMLLPLAWWFEDALQLPMPSFSSIAGIGGLALFGTAIAFSLYYKLLEQCGPTAISLVACFFPVGGMLLGVLFLDEVFTVGHIFAASIILLGMMIVNDVLPIKISLPKKTH